MAKANTHTHTDGHNNLETESAQWADAVKILIWEEKVLKKILNSYYPPSIIRVGRVWQT